MIYGIAAMAQTEDGYLWIGTQRGLWRFDGSQFLKWEPQKDGAGLPSQDIRSLAAAHGNGLWIGTAAGLSELIDHRLIRVWTSERGDVGPVVDGSKGVWAGSSSGVFLLQPAVRQILLGMSERYISALYEDKEQNVWIGTPSGLAKWRDGRVDLFLNRPATAVYAIAEDEEGRLVVATNSKERVVRIVDGKVEPVLSSAVNLQASIRVLVGDPDGGLWAGTFSDGLYRIRFGQLEHVSKQQGLSGPTVQALVEDRERNLWVGTRSGLDRFQEAAISRVTSAEGLSEDVITSVAAAKNDDLWVGTAAGGLNRIVTKRALRVERIKDFAGRTILSLFEDVEGRLWAGTMDGIMVESPHGFRTIHASSLLNRGTAITGDSHGNIWVASAGRGLFRIGRQGELTALNVSGLPQGTDIYGLLSDREGGLWIGYYHGSVALVRPGEVHVYDKSSGLSAGHVTCLFQDSMGSVWVGTTDGLSRFRNQRWTSWDSSNGLPLGGVQSIAEDNREDLWLKTELNLLRAPLGDLSRQGDGAPQPFPIVSFGVVDGLRPQIGAVWAQSREVKAGQGRIWIATEEGVAVINPARVRKNEWVPPAGLDDIKIDGNSVDVTRQSPSLKGKEVVFDYSAASLNSQDNLRFRYRLFGVDKQWQDAGSRREAHYSNLLPGSYNFRVITCNRDNVCDPIGASASFTLLPAFYQTWWFRGLTLVFLLSGLWGLYRVRLAVVSREITIRLNERLGERTRIARELHDTLLQSVVGVSLQLDGLARRLPSGDSAREDVERMRRHIDTSLRETRKSVQSLRTPISDMRDLSENLRELGSALTSGHTIHFSLAIEGTPYPIRQEVAEELVKISQEAIGNAVRHSQGTRIDTILTFARNQLRLEISDDGRGIEESVIQAGVSGHFGLRGMRERAAALGGQCLLTTEIGRGLRVVITVRRRRSPWKQFDYTT